MTIRYMFDEETSNDRRSVFVLKKLNSPGEHQIHSVVIVERVVIVGESVHATVRPFDDVV